MAPTPKFEVGESLVCIYQGKAPYEAKILEIKEHRGVLMYKVHFMGWNNRHDEKIPVGQEEGRLFKGTLAEYKSAHGLDDKTESPEAKPAASKKKGGAAAAAAKSSTPAVKTPKASILKTPAAAAASETRDGTPTTSRTTVQKATPSVNPSAGVIHERFKPIQLPQPLRKILIDDHELMTRGFVLKIPAARSADDILQDFMKTVPMTNDQIGNDDLHIEYDEGDVNTNNLVMVLTARGLIDYLNAVLGYQLLYKIERPQYNELVHKVLGDKTPVGVIAGADHGFRSSAHYGYVHLLRMLSRLPQLLQYSEWNDHLMQRIAVGANDIIVWLNKNRDTYYHEATDYETASIEYFRRVNTESDTSQSANN